MKKGEVCVEGRIRGTDMGMTGAPSSGATSSPGPGSDTPASMGHERLMVLPFAFYPLTSSFLPLFFPMESLLKYFHLSQFPSPTLHSAAVFSNIPVARRSNELQLRFTFLSNLGPNSHH